MCQLENNQFLVRRLPERKLLPTCQMLSLCINLQVSHVQNFQSSALFYTFFLTHRLFMTQNVKGFYTQVWVPPTATFEKVRVFFEILDIFWKIEKNLNFFLGGHHPTLRNRWFSPSPKSPRFLFTVTAFSQIKWRL